MIAHLRLQQNDKYDEGEESDTQKKTTELENFSHFLGSCHAGSNYDYDNWEPGVEPILTFHCPGSANDSDTDTTDGVPDVLDNAYLTYNPGQEDSDGYGNAADADFNNDDYVNFEDYNELSSNWGSSNPDPLVDMNSDGNVNFQDYNLLSNKWGTSDPYY